MEGGERKKIVGEKREEAMGEDDGSDTKCGGFLSEGMINR
jgi:hypothetical protein